MDILKIIGLFTAGILAIPIGIWMTKNGFSKTPKEQIDAVNDIAKNDPYFAGTLAVGQEVEIALFGVCGLFIIGWGIYEIISKIIQLWKIIFT